MTAPGILFRVATSSDVPGIAAAYLEAWHAAYSPLLPHEVLEEQASRRATYDWSGSVAGHQGTQVFVATQGEAVVAVLEFQRSPPHPETHPLIEMLYVVPRVWGTGAATSLLHLAERSFAADGHSIAALEVVERQARARRFYEREGWRMETSRTPRSNGLFNILYYTKQLVPAKRAA